MLQLFYIVLVLLNKMVGNLNFFHSLSVFFSLDDGQIWSVRKIWPSKHLWILVRATDWKHRLHFPSFSLAPSFPLFILQRKNTTEKSSSSPAFAFLTEFPSTLPSSPHQGENSSRHGAVATTERWTVSACMQYVGVWGHYRCRKRERKAKNC